MRQVSLFDTTESAAYVKPQHADDSQRNINFYPDFYSWLSAARDCLDASLHPSRVWWLEDRAANQKGKCGGSSEFLQQARAASCHSNEDRWALLYSILWRLRHGEAQLLELAGDTEVARMRKYAKAVARDVHKMKAFVRFREIPGREETGNPPRYVSWFEPQHFIVEYAAPFFKRRFATMQWSILTPVGCAHWEGTGEGNGELWFSNAVEKEMAPTADKFEDAWRIYYKSIFNPARLKITAMQSEMPKKYWKNLPEAQEIDSLISAAEIRTRQMISQRKQHDKLHCGTRPNHPDQILQQQIKSSATTPLQALKLQASACKNCPQGNAATQTVFGVGPENAKLMIVGEQPGDQEDLEGQPFIGPAGQVLSAALKRAGIDQNQCYLTNAVKHFGFVPRGKRRIHKKPEASTISACSPWLYKEIEILDPDVVIYLGATAASTCFGPQVRVQRDRGKLIYKAGRHHLITVHPSSILRMPRGPGQNRAYTQFIADLTLEQFDIGN